VYKKDIGIKISLCIAEKVKCSRQPLSQRYNSCTICCITEIHHLLKKKKALLFTGLTRQTESILTAKTCSGSDVSWCWLSSLACGNWSQLVTESLCRDRAPLVQGVYVVSTLLVFRACIHMNKALFTA